jgi:hypothetical protein
MVSGRYARGARTRAKGYAGKSNWCKTTKAEIVAAQARLQFAGIADNYSLPA